MKNRDSILEKIRLNKELSWVADEIEETLARGISKSVKEISDDSAFFQLDGSSPISKRERNKRQKYETTRSLTEAETLDVIKNAIRSVFKDLPSIQNAAALRISELGIDFDSIQFVEEGDLLDSEKFNANAKQKSGQKYLEAYRNFEKELAK